MQNTTTKSARNTIRAILAQHNIPVSAHSYTNKCANPQQRNLCFLVKNIPSSVVQQIEEAITVSKVHTTRPMFYNVHPDARYLRVVHCSM